MADQPFKYYPSDQVDVGEYEYVEFKNRAPRNTTDYHDMQSVLRYRQALSIVDLFGNLRIDSGSDAVTLVGSQFQANGIFYFDGYRMDVNNTITPIVANLDRDYYVYLYIKYELITFENEGRIALTDENLNTQIETSYRYKFTYTLVAHEGDTPDTPPVLTGYDVYYKLGKMAYSAGYTYEADGANFSDVDLNYQQAIDIVANALRVESSGLDEGSAIVEKMITAADGNARVRVEETDEDNVKLVFEDDLGNLFAAFEAVKTNGVWNPVLWLQSSVDENATAYITPHGFHIFDKNGNLFNVDVDSLVVGSSISKFNYTPSKFQITQDSKNAINAYVSKSGVSSGTHSTLAKVTGLTGNIGGAGYDNGGTVDNDANPLLAYEGAVIGRYYIEGSTNLYSINHKMTTESTKKVQLNITVLAAYNTGHDVFSVVGQKSYILGGDITSTIADSFVVSLNQSQLQGGEANDLKFRTEYTVSNLEDTTDVDVVIGYLEDYALTWDRYSIIETALEANVFQNGKYGLWVDGDGVLRVKDIGLPEVGSDVAVQINEMQINDIGTDLTSPGGKPVGLSNLSTELAIGPLLPQFSGSALRFPNAATVGVTGGLLTKAQYDSMINPLSSPYIYPKGNGIASHPIFVCQEWSTGSPPEVYVTNISAAINSITYKGTIFLYPGIYIENIDMSLVGNVDKEISIIALDPKDTVIRGKITGQTTAGKRLYIDCPLEANGNEVITVGYANIELGPNATVTSTEDKAVIRLEGGGSFTSNAPITHTRVASSFPTILVASTYATTIVNINSNITTNTAAEAIGLSNYAQTQILNINNATISGTSKGIKISNTNASTVQVEINNSQITGGADGTIEKYSMYVNERSAISKFIIRNTNTTGSMVDDSAIAGTPALSVFDFLNCTGNHLDVGNSIWVNKLIFNRRQANISVAMADAGNEVQDMNYKPTY